MARTKQQSKASKAGNKTSSKPKQPKQQPGDAVPRKQSPDTRKKAGAKPDDIAVMLSRRVIEGDLDGVNTLLKVEDRIKAARPTRKKRRGLTEAQLLALSPPWQGEPDQDFLQAEAAKLKQNQ
ncbi:MAG TPA: hypothetical protein VGT08_07805 [Terracidiphilus sp.]|nr:hypothetical protein [Terracidiphilus sp.]